ncbi:hypothetical protein K490DRAFT_57328 [Saccharata proteae CBS 121410]|uniref:Guanine nucleotide-exchange factor SEC12 n=1 Tax=Saccharata proteae CBS 121410 TaxID=1314787 RepID=A0A9P4LUT8_9PEZI|nr:hypothetical protein K490DRAFT_57328 [Saccharata proteae CBS 121410]
MSPPVSFAKATLDYPIYSADFDPYNRGYLVVGGGGGEGRSGVKNKISLLDVSSRASLEPAGEIQLTSDEDAVMSMANLASKDGLITFAGINSTTKEREANKNEHLRAFKIEYPRRKRAGQEAEKEEEKTPEGKISLLSKTNLFSTPSTTTAKKENYQRLLRLSPAQKRESGSKRIGAIATSLNPKSELVVFNATSTAPSGSEIIQRIFPKDGADVNDVDISEDAKGNFAVAYCTDHQVFVSDITYDFNKKKATSTTPADEIRPKWSFPFPDTFSKAARPIIKYIRFLAPDHLLFCSNLPGKKGVELTILRLYGDGPGDIVLKKKLPSHVKAAGGLDVCALDADAATGARQVVVAVAGHDISISIYTLDHSGPSTSTISRFRSYTTMRDVHPLQMTKILFSPFHSPWPSSSTTNPSDAIKAPSPQYLRLASTSLANTVVVDTLPLRPLHPRKHGSRYILAGGSSPILDTTIPILTIGFALLVTLLIFQSYIDAKNGGVVTSTGHTINIIPARLRAALAQVRPPLPPGARVPHHISDMPSAIADAVPTAIIEPIRSSAGRLRDLIAQHHPSSNTDPSPPSSAAAAQKAIMVVHDSESGLSTEVHASTAEALRKDAEARRWDDLSAEQREAWKERLVRAGEWAVEEGEALLKSVLFREYAGMVGAFGDWMLNARMAIDAAFPGYAAGLAAR